MNNPDKIKEVKKINEPNEIEELEVKIFEAEFEEADGLVINYGSVLQCTECC